MACMCTPSRDGTSLKNMGGPQLSGNTDFRRDIRHIITNRRSAGNIRGTDKSLPSFGKRRVQTTIAFANPKCADSLVHVHVSHS